MDRKAMKCCLIGICCISMLAAGCTGGKGGDPQKEQSSETMIQTLSPSEKQTEEETVIQTLSPSEKQTEEETGGLMIDAVIQNLRIVDGTADGRLILAETDGSAVYTLTVGDIPVYLDGELAEAAVLEDGMTIDVSYNGSILETWPAQIDSVAGILAYSRGTEKNPGGTTYDLSGLYLKVLNDLWDTDPGLNGNVTYISVDLSDAPGDLSEGEKAAIAWIFAGQHGGEPLTLSYRELVEEGYCQELDWEDGILFSITTRESEIDKYYSLPFIQFDAQKWRAGDGAYFFMNCLALWPEMGTWSDYSVSDEAIS